MKPYVLDPYKTIFLAIDLQERLLPAIHNREEVIKNAKKLIASAQIMGIPFKLTEQYPRGLGRTEQEILSVLPGPVFEKTAFGCFDQEGFESFLAVEGRNQVVLFGIESHICVHTTAMQLLERGYDVTVTCDGCGSRERQNHDFAMANMSNCGAHILPFDSVIYQLMKRSGTPDFKALLPLFKE